MIIRSLSFKKNEEDLANEYDNNGKSEFAKSAMKFYLTNKDKIIINSLNELVSLFGNNQNSQNSHKQPSNSIKKMLR
jgi:hypothetical protein